MRIRHVAETQQLIPGTLQAALPSVSCRPCRAHRPTGSVMGLGLLPSQLGVSIGEPGQSSQGIEREPFTFKLQQFVSSRGAHQLHLSSQASGAEDDRVPVGMSPKDQAQESL
ncbi:transcription factor COE2 isoform X1, partial [Lates japonicus]